MLYTGLRPFSIMSWASRFKLIMMLFKQDWTPVVRFPNGVELDFSSKKVILNNPVHIHARESFKITSDKHLIMNSGRVQVDGREPGYVYGFWANTDLDQNGDPILEKVNTSFLVSSTTPVRLWVIGNSVRVW